MRRRSEPPCRFPYFAVLPGRLGDVTGPARCGPAPAHCPPPPPGSGSCVLSQEKICASPISEKKIPPPEVSRQLLPVVGRSLLRSSWRRQIPDSK
jgi:hypothetical protein